MTRNATALGEKTDRVSKAGIKQSIYRGMCNVVKKKGVCPNKKS